MKILFVMFDGGGNVAPQLATARALRARGTRFTSSAIADFVNASRPKAFVRPTYRRAAGRLGAQIRERDGAAVAAEEFVGTRTSVGGRDAG